ncbi:MAG TPA: hypothetical protein VMX58_08740 [Patescibacteria group bacterium]|nr:hypothetical protein [Patescibacteria group bacterium]
MRKTSKKQNFPFIPAALILFAVLLVIYIPLKIRVARSDDTGDVIPDGTTLSIFVTSDLKGYREPCG